VSIHPEGKRYAHIRTAKGISVATEAHVADQIDSYLPSQQRALPSHQCCISLSRSQSAPDIRLVAERPPSRYLFSNASEAQYRQQRRRSYHGVTTDLPSLNSELFSVAPSPSLANSATVSSWVCGRAEELQGVRYAMPTSGAHAWDCR
jgi:hypothetical protein